MNIEDRKLLLCTNGVDATLPSLDYGVWLAGLLNIPVTLLGIVEHPDYEEPVHRLVNRAAQKLDKLGVPNQIQLDSGRGTVVISRYARMGNFITAVGPLGRPAWRRVVQGRSFRRLLTRIETPILYIPQARIPLKHILLCMGGLGYADSVAHLCGELAQVASAEITILHVVEPVTLDYPTSKRVHEHWKDILETDTPQGRNLLRASNDLRKLGLPVEFKVRHGNIVGEIAEEISSGVYDLIGMGSPYSTHGLRRLYTLNITADVAETANIPVLSMRWANHAGGND